MNDSTLIFALSGLSCASWIGVSMWMRRRKRTIGLPLRACFQTALQVSLVLGVFAASVERFSFHTQTEPLLDFAPLYAGGRLVLESPEHLYDPREQLRVEKESTQMPLQDDDLLPFPYPPFVAVALALPALFDFTSAYRVFLLLNFASLLLTVYLLVRQLQLDQSRSQALVLLITAFFPVYLTLKQGQLSLIFGLLYTLFWLRLSRGNLSHSFWWAGLLTGKPPLLPVPVWTLATRQQWRPLVGLTGALAAAVGTSAALDRTRCPVRLRPPLDRDRLRSICEHLPFRHVRSEGFGLLAGSRKPDLDPGRPPAFHGPVDDTRMDSESLGLLHLDPGNSGAGSPPLPFICTTWFWFFRPSPWS